MICAEEKVLVVGPDVRSLDDIIERTWDQKMRDGVFRYALHPGSLPTRTDHPDGDPLVLLSIPGRATKPPRSSSDESLSTHVACDPFRFHAAPTKERLFWLSESPADSGLRCYNDSKPLSYPHLMLVNAFPIGHLSSLFAPLYRLNKTQHLDHQSALAGLDLASRLWDPGLRIGFNALSAGASVDHLHFQVWRHNASLAAEVAAVRALGVVGGCHVAELSHYRAVGLRFAHATDPHHHASCAALLSRCAAAATELQLSYNLLLTGPGAGGHAFFFLRRPGVTHPQHGIRMGFPAMSGFVILVHGEPLDTVDATEIAEFIRNNVSASAAQFEVMKRRCLSPHNSSLPSPTFETLASDP